MPDIEWSPSKNEELKRRYGIGFERALLELSRGGLLVVRRHPNVERYGHQKQIVLSIDGYAWVISYVEDERTIFWKTMYPSRKATRQYLGG